MTTNKFFMRLNSALNFFWGLFFCFLLALCVHDAFAFSGYKAAYHPPSLKQKNTKENKSICSSIKFNSFFGRNVLSTEGRGFNLFNGAVA